MLFTGKEETFRTILSLGLFCTFLSVGAFIYAYFTNHNCEYCLMERGCLLIIGFLLIIAGYLRSSSAFMFTLFPCLYGSLTAYSHLIITP